MKKSAIILVTILTGLAFTSNDTSAGNGGTGDFDNINGYNTTYICRCRHGVCKEGKKISTYPPCAKSNQVLICSEYGSNCQID